MMARDRKPAGMSLRTFTRRKTSMALVIVGLMIGTAMISGSLVTGDTLTNLFTRGAYNGYGYADEVVYSQSGGGGCPIFRVRATPTLYQTLSNTSTTGSRIPRVTSDVPTSSSSNKSGGGGALSDAT